jgi:hypothetical protein
MIKGGGVKVKSAAGLAAAMGAAARAEAAREVRTAVSLSAAVHKLLERIEDKRPDVRAAAVNAAVAAKLVEVVTLNKSPADYGMELDDDNVIVNITSDMQAASSGNLQLGDRIVALNDKVVNRANPIRSLAPLSFNANANFSIVKAAILNIVRLEAEAAVAAATAESPSAAVYKLFELIGDKRPGVGMAAVKAATAEKLVKVVTLNKSSNGYGMRVNDDNVIINITSGMQAARSGLQVNDCIVALNDMVVNRANPLAHALASTALTATVVNFYIVTAAILKIARLEANAEAARGRAEAARGRATEAAAWAAVATEQAATETAATAARLADLDAEKARADADEEEGGRAAAEAAVAAARAEARVAAKRAEEAVVTAAAEKGVARVQAAFDEARREAARRKADDTARTEADDAASEEADDAAQTETDDTAAETTAVGSVAVDSAEEGTAAAGLAGEAMVAADSAVAPAPATARVPAAAVDGSGRRGWRAWQRPRAAGAEGGPGGLEMTQI